MNPFISAAEIEEELRLIPIPQRTTYDSRGLPATTILADGTVLRPIPSKVGTELRWRDEEFRDPKTFEVVVREGVIIWDGVIPFEARGRSAEGGETRPGLTEGEAGTEVSDREEGQRQAA